MRHREPRNSAGTGEATPVKARHSTAGAPSAIRVPGAHRSAASRSSANLMRASIARSSAVFRSNSSDWSSGIASSSASSAVRRSINSRVSIRLAFYPAGGASAAKWGAGDFIRRGGRSSGSRRTTGHPAQPGQRCEARRMAGQPFRPGPRLRPAYRSRSTLPATMHCREKASPE